MKILKILLTILFMLLFGTAVNAAIVASDHNLGSDDSLYILGWVYSRIDSSFHDSNEANTIYKINLKDNSKSIVYQGPGKSLSELSLSPDNKLISVLKDHEDFKPQSELLIIDVASGTVKDNFKDRIRIYTWSPDSKKILYITGIEIEGAGLSPEGVYIYDIDKKSKKKIADGAQSILWTNNDEILLINYSTYEEKGKGYKKPKASKYGTVVFDAIQNKTLPGVVKGVNFSLDGRYSILPDPQYDTQAEAELGLKPKSVNIYNVKEKKVRQLSAFFNTSKKIVWREYIWAANNRLASMHSFTGGKADELSFCDIANDSIIKQVAGTLVGTNSARDKFVVFNGKTFSAIDVP